MLNGEPIDLLSSFQELVTGLVQAGLLAEEEANKTEREGTRQGAESLKQAKAFRTIMRETVERLAARRPVPQATLDAVNQLLRHRVGYPQIGRRGGAFERTYRAEFDGCGQLLGLLAEAASDLLCVCDLSLIKKCQNPACVLFFYDTTKNEPCSSLVQHEFVWKSQQGCCSLSSAPEAEEMREAAHTVVGVDVGGAKKGFHAVALQDNQIVGKLVTCNAADVAAWCREQRASAVGIDAPCQWSLTGKARPCERELAGLGLSSFSTPCLTVGKVHPFYGWMVNGADLFRLLAPHYRLYIGRTAPLDGLCFETFPHAIACTLAGKALSAKNKRVDRRRVLEQAEIGTDALKSIDDIDGALCALAAQHVLAGSFKAFGDAAEGFILVPHR